MLNRISLLECGLPHQAPELYSKILHFMYSSADQKGARNVIVLKLKIGDLKMMLGQMD